MPLIHPRWNTASQCLAFHIKEGLKTEFTVSVDIDGKTLTGENWQPLPGGGALGKTGGLELAVHFKSPCAEENGKAVYASITNRTAAAVKLHRFRFVSKGALFPAHASALRFYKEGWTMTSPAASLGPGEKDFFLNPDYKAFASSIPKDHADHVADRFSADYVTVLHDREAKANLLVGFVSSQNQIGRFVIAVDGGGLSNFEVISEADGCKLDPGERLDSEEWVMAGGDDPETLLTQFADIWGQRMKARHLAATPTGWCSWAYYFHQITEAAMLENASFLHANRQNFPVEYIQMDDGYQAALGDWLECDTVKFPHGLEYLAKEIRAKGFKPGIWLAPFLIEEKSALYRAHSEWAVKDASGQTVWAMANWRGSRVAILDATRPEACAFLNKIFATLSRWGYEYVKLDFLVHLAGVAALGGVYADPKATRVTAIRRGLEAMRKGFGEDKLILACTNVLGAGVGLVDACRIGTDFLPSWNINGEPFKEAPTLPNVCRNVINRCYMNGRLWVNDPDAHIARSDENKLTLDEVRMFTAALWISGGMILTGDRFSTLSEDRGKLSQMLLKNLDAFEDVRPLDRFESEYPCQWFGRSRKNNRRCVIGLFNFTESETNLHIDLDRAVGAVGAKSHTTELWSGFDFGVKLGVFSVRMKAHSSQVLLLDLV